MEVELINGTELTHMLIRCDAAAGTCVSPEIPGLGAHTFKMGEEMELTHLYHAMRSGHMSVLEHCTLTFAIEGISRACSHQLVRHRLMSVEQQSQRYVKHDGGYVMPSSVEDSKCVNQFSYAMHEVFSIYESLIRHGVPEEDARYLLPNACMTNMVVTMNLREFIHFCGLRRCKRAQWEIRELADRMAREVAVAVPWLRPWVEPQCILLGYCPEAKSCGRVMRRSLVTDISTPHDTADVPKVRLFPVVHDGTGGVR